jgi:hypothetical protein
MNKRLSKLKNIQEANILLEKRNRVNESDFGGENQEPISNVEDVKKYLHEVANHVEHIAEQFRDKLGNTDFWPYVKGVYSTLRDFSDVDAMHTRSDQQGGNITYVINHLDGDFSDNDNSSDIPGFEGTMDSLNNLGI